MVCLGREPGAAEWKAQTKPLNYGGTSTWYKCLQRRRLLFRVEDLARVFVHPSHRIKGSLLDSVKAQAKSGDKNAKRTLLRNGTNDTNKRLPQSLPDNAMINFAFSLNTT